MPKQPLAEVFGFPIDNMTAGAKKGRSEKLCPFNNIVPECTKVDLDDPLGVCSVFHTGGHTAITCPVRFKEDWLIAQDAAAFFFPKGANVRAIPEVQLRDADGKSAGNIDLVLAQVDDHDRIIDFGALEIQAVYISGNVRTPFAYYMEDPAVRKAMDWSGESGYPRADYLSSSRKRLAPQLLYKGGVVNGWKKKLAVALDKGFFATLPHLDQVDASKAEVAWMVYDLAKDATENRFHLKREQIVYTTFGEALKEITTAKPSDQETFVTKLTAKMNVNTRWKS